MRRVSSNLSNNDVQYNLRLQESKLNKVNNQMGSQQKIQELRDDPLAAGHLVRYQSFLTRVETYENNSKNLSEQYAVTEGYVNQTVQIMQRIRELAVNSANGIYNEEDLKNMSVEVDELLGEIIQNANAVGPEGNSLFSGTKTTTTAFTPLKGNVNGAGHEVITQVLYNGSINQNKVEVTEKEYLGIDKAGNQVFWAEQQQLLSNKDVTTWQSTGEGKINVNGIEITLTQGDNVYSVIAKINSSGAPVKASLDPVSNGLNFQTTDARQLWLEDIEGTSLQDLGIIKERTQRAPNNFSENTMLSGGSVFDTVIALRDAMLSSDSESIGGRVLGSIDSALNSLTTNLAEIGAKTERLNQDIARAQKLQLNVTNMISNEGDLDITETITDMKMLEYVQQATLSTAGKLYKNTLLDYVK